MKAEKKYSYLIKKKIEKVLDHHMTTIFISIITIIVLFGDDLRQAVLIKPDDNYVDSLFLICWLIFITELILSCYAKHGYLFSFFFWMDVVSIITIPSDIYFIVYAIMGTNGAIIPTDATSVARAGRASRVGTRVARLIRLLRLIRLIRIAKFVK